jgi:hypothetical protein
MRFRQPPDPGNGRVNEHLVPPVRAGFAAPRCAVGKGASNPARWCTLHSVLLLHGVETRCGSSDNSGFLLLVERPRRGGRRLGSRHGRRDDSRRRRCRRGGCSVRREVCWQIERLARFVALRRGRLAFPLERCLLPINPERLTNRFDQAARARAVRWCLPVGVEDEVAIQKLLPLFPSCARTRASNRHGSG